ncbi:MAG: TRAP transporter small permease subunit [Pseudomonadota bacterium]|nr:TRAP transporter small permease subunit [Pseudomonadota bacterium]
MAEKGQVRARGASRAMRAADTVSIALRGFAWAIVAATFVFILNNYLTNWLNWPGPMSVLGEGTALAWVQLLFYVAGVAAALAFAYRTGDRPVRADSAIMYGIVNYIVRVSFWAVFLIGTADAVVSFLRVEGMLPGLFGEPLATDLGRSAYRGVWVHFPMLALAIVIATLTRGLAFHWLAFLVVASQLLIVITRFIFSYEQAFMSDLIRFWYAALFLFASAYTLFEDGHVRVDVLYSGFDDRRRGLINAVGAVVLGFALCWVIMVLGMASKSAIINSPLLAFETTQTGFGMYVKYWMAGYLGIFAITMLIQFTGSFLEGAADYRGEPGKRVLQTESAGVS